MNHISAAIQMTGFDNIAKGRDLFQEGKFIESAEEFLIATGKFNADMAIVLQAAMQGSALAQFVLGSIFLQGEVEIDPGQAFYWHQRAAQGGHKEAMFRIAWAYRNGLGVAENAVLSNVWLRRSAELGHAPAKLELVMDFVKSLRTQPNSTYRDFLEVLSWSNTPNCPEAELCLIYLHSAHESDERESRYDSINSNGGIANVMYELGMKYLLRKGDEDSFIQALHWLGEAVRRNHIHAMVAVGCLHLLGTFRGNNVDNANWFFSHAAELRGEIYENRLNPYLLGNNNVMKQYIKLSGDRNVLVKGCISGLACYGYLYHKGIGVQKDYLRAREIYLSVLRLIDADDSDANMCLGILCTEQEDYVKAMRYFKRSAKSVNTYTYNLIGDAFRLGNGRGPDMNTALYWYNKGADLGDGYSFFNIGKILLESHGEKKTDMVRFYFDRAVTCGCPEANAFLN
ncbi:unnamed protein product [Mucor hiemalis]